MLRKVYSDLYLLFSVAYLSFKRWNKHRVLKTDVIIHAGGSMGILATKQEAASVFLNGAKHICVLAKRINQLRRLQKLEKAVNRQVWIQHWIHTCLFLVLWFVFDNITTTLIYLTITSELLDNRELWILDILLIFELNNTSAFLILLFQFKLQLVFLWYISFFWYRSIFAY